MVMSNCKNNSIGNCKPIQNGEEYCLYHKPNKTETEAKLFYDIIIGQAEVVDANTTNRKYLYNNIDWRGYVFPELVNNDLINDNCVITIDRNLENTTYFNNSTFIGIADFEGAIFEGKINFEGVTFEGIASFKATIFKNKASFKYVIFNSFVLFEETRFDSSSDFTWTKFKKRSSFESALFEGRADFCGAIYESIATFEKATFKGDIEFAGVIFNDLTVFEKTTFNGVADFTLAKFVNKANFVNSYFYSGTSFGTAIFKDEASFTGIIFNGNVLFNGALFERTAYFKNSSFGGLLYFKNVDFRQGVVMEYNWQKPEKNKYKLFQAEKEGCRVQRISYENEGDREAADNFFVREMRARREAREINYKTIWNPNEDDILNATLNAQKLPLWKNKGFRWKLWSNIQWKNIINVYIRNWLEKWAIDITCKYGTDWYSLVLASFFLITLFSIIYFTSYFTWFFGSLNPQSLSLTKQPLSALLDAIYKSIVIFSTLGSNDINPEGLMRFIVGLQSLIGTFFIALFVVVFARKWMRS